MVLPNLTMRSIYMDYYNEMNHIEGNAQRYVPTYERFTEERRFEPLVQNYFEQYLGQFPAQVFDKINENFIRCSFFELCSRYLSSCYTFAIEQNNSAGRSNFEMTGIPARTITRTTGWRNSSISKRKKRSACWRSAIPVPRTWRKCSPTPRIPR